MIFCRDGRLVNNRLLQDLGSTVFLCKMDLLWLYVLFEVWHVTVADLDSVNTLFLKYALKILHLRCYSFLFVFQVVFVFL